MTLPPVRGELTLANVRAVDDLVRSLATYVPDAALRDSWTSFHKEVMAGQPFEGDCDDWAQTAIQVLFLLGAPKSVLYRALVSSSGGEAIDHMIGLVRLPDGSMWSIGDTFGPPALVDGDKVGPHKIIETAQVSRGRKFSGRKLSGRRETTAASMSLRTSPAGRAFMKAHETFVATTYDDKQPRKKLTPTTKILGTLTIGYGHTGPDVKIGMTITRAHGERLFEEDLKPMEAEIRKAVRVPLEQHQFDALSSFVFNVGVPQFLSSTLLKKINARAPEHEIQAQFRRWIYSTGAGGKRQVMPGLVRRRNHEAAMWAGEVVTAGAIQGSLRLPEISCDHVVEEYADAKKSPDVYLAGGTAAAGGGLALWSAVLEAFQEFRNTVAETDLTLIYSLLGVIIAGVSGYLLYKRLREIWAARQ